MTTAWDLANAWGIVPKYSRDDGVPPDIARHAFLDELKKMQAAYLERAEVMQRPPKPGPRPADHDLPPFPDYDASQDEVKAWGEKNDVWLDTVYYPAEAERVIWEAAHEVYDQRARDRRAARGILYDRLNRVLDRVPTVFYATGAAAFVTYCLTVWL